VSSKSRGFGRRTGGTITVIETRVHRSTARKAKIGFWLTTFVVAILAAPVLSDRMNPVVALFVGAFLGTVAGAGVWTAIRVWPFFRIIWWWLTEITVGLGIVFGFLRLCHHTPMPVRIAVVAVVFGLPAAIGPVRRCIKAVSYCVEVRHRIRTAFARFIITDQAGTLPLIFLAKPTPVGARVTLYLRGGFSASELESRLEKLAGACRASIITITRASDRNAAWVRLDIKRREVLGATVNPGLVDLVDPNTPKTVRDNGAVPTALDLPDIPATATAGKPAEGRTDEWRRPSPKPRPAEAPTLSPVPQPAAAGLNGENVSDWI